MSTLNFKNAVDDYRLLKNRLYPDKAALKLVGDRYRLSAVERNCLLRGVVAGEPARARRAKLAGEDAVSGSDLGIDWFNVLITLESYLKGGVLFLGDDGLLRDSSSVHGSYRPGPQTERAIGLILETVALLRPRRVDVFFDSPISHSKKMRDDLERRLLAGAFPFSFCLSLEASADYALKAYRGIVASSDSIVADGSRVVVDLPRIALERAFGFHPLALDDLEP
jgi:hypothetical protein